VCVGSEHDRNDLVCVLLCSVLDSRFGVLLEILVYLQ
jgi:hypothetical protein